MHSYMTNTESHNMSTNRNVPEWRVVRAVRVFLLLPKMRIKEHQQ